MGLKRMEITKNSLDAVEILKESYNYKIERTCYLLSKNKFLEKWLDKFKNS